MLEEIKIGEMYHVKGDFYHNFDDGEMVKVLDKVGNTYRCVDVSEFNYQYIKSENLYS